MSVFQGNLLYLCRREEDKGQRCGATPNGFSTVKHKRAVSEPNPLTAFFVARPGQINGIIWTLPRFRKIFRK